jgi:hypothetical protein
VLEIIDAALWNEKKFSAVVQAMRVERGPGAARGGFARTPIPGMLSAVESEKDSFAKTAARGDSRCAEAPMMATDHGCASSGQNLCRTQQRRASRETASRG